jgi:hypothetical protein
VVYTAEPVKTILKKNALDAVKKEDIKNAK